MQLSVYISQYRAGFGTLLIVGCLRVIEPVLSPHRYKRLQLILHLLKSESLFRRHKSKSFNVFRNYFLQKILVLFVGTNNLEFSLYAFFFKIDLTK
jgi:hypothetical protein